MMLRFDHAVVHIASDTSVVDNLSEEIQSSGLPFKITQGRDGKGFKTFILTIGRHYLEIVQLMTAEGEGWVEHWVSRFNEGKRGVFALFFAVENLDSLFKELQQRSLSVQRDGRSVLGSILKALNIQRQKQNLYLPEIPGTGFEVDFEQYYEKSRENSTGESAKAGVTGGTGVTGVTGVTGGTGVSRIKIFIPEWTEGLEFLKKIFPEVSDEKMEKRILLQDNGELFFYRTGVKEPSEVQLDVFVSHPSQAGKKIKIENLEIKTVLKTEK